MSVQQFSIINCNLALGSLGLVPHIGTTLKRMSEETDFVALKMTCLMFPDSDNQTIDHSEESSADLLFHEAFLQKNVQILNASLNIVHFTVR